MPPSKVTPEHYIILQPIGKGGMGQVFLAEDTVLDRKVALKFLSESLQQDLDARKRFLREAKSAAALDHPFVCRIYETGEIDGKAFIAMEYVVGKTLSQRLEDGPIPLEEAFQITLEIAEALEEAHAKGIVHRDLKPSNIMVTPKGHVKVMDFGLAKQVAAAEDPGVETSTLSGGLTCVGALVGTPAYMSPEQARGQPVDARSDIFSFGIVLFEILSGKHPFQRASQIETLSAILLAPPPPLRVQADTVPPELSSILNKALAKDVSQRYQSIAELATDIQALKEQLLPQRRAVWVKWALVSAVPLLVAAILFTWWIARRAPPTPSSLSVLIADFQNLTGDPVFNPTLESYSANALELVSFITLYDRGRARNIGGEISPNSPLDGSLARLVAIREGVDVVLSGSISNQPRGYHISVQASYAASGKPVSKGGERDIADKTGAPAAIDKLIAPIRRSLGDTKPETSQPGAGETFTASSLEAAHQYAQAQEMQWAGKRDAAVEFYRKAIQLDPAFGRAYAGLAAIQANRLQLAEAEENYRKALGLLDRMSERERFRTQGGYYLMMRNPKAIDEFTELLKLYPADTAGISNLALAYFYAHDMQVALKESRRTVNQYPKVLFYRSNMALFAMYAGEFEIAASEARSVLAQDPSDEYAWVALAMSVLAQGHPEQAMEEYRHAAEAVGARAASIATLGLSDLALYEGRVSDAAAMLEKGIAGDLGNNDPSAAAYKLVALARAQLIQGNSKAALDAAARAVASNKKESIALAAADVYVEAGQETKALALAADLGKRIEPDPQSYAKLVEGEVALKRSKVHDAIRVFQEAQKLADSWLGHLALGRAYLEAAAFTEALIEFEKCLKRRGEAAAVFLDDMPSYRYFPPIYYYLGRAQEGLQSPAAADSYRKFLDIKRGGSDPLIADARRRLGSR